MKYTREYCKEHKVAVHTGNNEEMLFKIKKLFGLTTASGCVYKEEHCVNLEGGCHQTVEFYKKRGFEVLSIEELFTNETYEIY